MSDEKPSPVMSETLIERSVSLANRAITMGYPVPIALAALETALIAAWKECDAPVMLDLLAKWASAYESSLPRGPHAQHCDCRYHLTLALLDKHGRS